MGNVDVVLTWRSILPRWCVLEVRRRRAGALARPSSPEKAAGRELPPELLTRDEGQRLLDGRWGTTRRRGPGTVRC